MPSQKPHKWNKQEDALTCVECIKPFKRGDNVYTDVAVNVHVTCLPQYVKSLKKLGLLSKALSGKPCRSRLCPRCKGHGIVISQYKTPIVRSGKECIGSIVPCEKCKSQGKLFTAKPEAPCLPK